MRNLTAAFVLSLLAGCGAGQSVVQLTVTSDGVLRGVSTLHVATTVGGHSATETVVDVHGPIDFTPQISKTLNLVFPSDKRGALTCTVTARDKDGNLISTAQTTGTVTPSQVSAVSVVLTGAPSALTYSKSSLICTKGVMCGLPAPTNMGGKVASYSIDSNSPPLPDGLLLDPATGAIYGIIKTIAPQASYTIIATNPAGSTTSTLTITVNDVAPWALTYTPSPLVCTINQQCSSSPSNSGGTVISYALDPGATLPAGLTLDLTTGVISGKPTQLQPAPGTAYRVTATNSGGSTAVQVSVVVNDVPPSIAYDPSAIYCSQNQPCNLSAPMNSGGAIQTWSISPADLPPGLTFDTSTGGISGTPTAFSDTKSYTVTAANSGGDSTATVTVRVYAPRIIGQMGAVAAGEAHACAVVNGGVQCWGSNSKGELGNNTTSDSSVPVVVNGVTSGAQTVSGGTRHSCALVNGGVKCWGDNSYGQLGDGSLGGDPSPVPVTVSGLTNVQAIASGLYCNCALVNGGAQCWGDNGWGQLGNNSTDWQSSSPVQVVGLASGVEAIATGGNHTCAVVNGGVKCWGYGQDGELGNNTTTIRYASTPVDVYGLGNGSGVQAVAVGFSHTCALVNGGVQCWGDNGYYQLGNGSTQENSSTPVPVTNLRSGVQAIAAGGNHTCALVNGVFQCWGYGYYGQLGNNSSSSSNVPVPVPSISNGGQALALGYNFSCGLANGAIQCWGYNAYGQLGNGSTEYFSRVPVPVSGLNRGLAGIGLGINHSCAVVDGAVQCWGDNAYGQLGTGTTMDSYVPILSSLTGVQAISAGSYSLHSCAVANGGVQCWGWNQFGQLGNSTTTNSSLPVQVAGLTSGVQATTTANGFSCAVMNGAVQCWGNSTPIASQAPVLVSGLSSGVVSVSGGLYHACAVANGGIKCWGANSDGQLGNGTTTYSSSPVPVSNSTSGAQAVVTGYGFSCGQVNGGVQCWGDNAYGQLGAGNMTQRSSVPVAVSGLGSGVQAIAAGSYHACALVNGGVQCWGYNAGGQLGNNTTTNSYSPVMVSGLSSGVQAIAAGGSHTCAVKNGQLWCWGNNSNGELGNDSSSQSATPVPVAAPWP